MSTRRRQHLAKCIRSAGPRLAIARCLRFTSTPSPADRLTSQLHLLLNLHSLLLDLLRLPLGGRSRRRRLREHSPNRRARRSRLRRNPRLQIRLKLRARPAKPPHRNPTLRTTSPLRIPLPSDPNVDAMHRYPVPTTSAPRRLTKRRPTHRESLQKYTRSENVYTKCIHQIPSICKGVLRKEIAFETILMKKSFRKRSWIRRAAQGERVGRSG